MESGKIVCGMYLDLKKAFDTVDHSILARKLKIWICRLSTQSLEIIPICNRYQFVEYYGIRSTLKSVQIGVAQGSIHGPFLFLFYINDFPNISKNVQFLLFADDTAIFIESVNESMLQLLIDQE